MATYSMLLEDLLRSKLLCALPIYRDGFALWTKRLEAGTYAMPFGEPGVMPRREITAPELAALLSGIDLQRSTRRKRYARKCASTLGIS